MRTNDSFSPSRLVKSARAKNQKMNLGTEEKVEKSHIHFESAIV